MATATVDTSYVAASYEIPEPTLKTLLESPTSELIQDLLKKIEEKAREHESVQAEKLRSDVELETAVQNGNRRAKQLKESVDKGLKEVEELRKKLSSEETTRASLESQLQTLKSSSSSSNSEVEALHARISYLETSNNDVLSLLEAKTTAHDKLADDLSAQQQKAVALRREFGDLEEKYQASENASMSAKFREQSLKQEVDLLKKNNEWHEKELRLRTSEHTKYRKEKSAQIGELQRSLEDLTQANDTLRSTETTLRNRLDEMTRKLEDAYAQIQTKDEDAVKREDSFRAEQDTALRLAELQRKSAETAKARQQELERSLDQLKDDAATEIGNLQADINSERTDKEAAEYRVAELEARLHIVEGELAAAQHAPSRPSTPRRGANGVSAHGTPGRTGSPGLLATPGGSRLKGGLTMTQIYSEYSKAKSELDAERRRNESLSSELDNMIQDLENRQPEFEELHVDRVRLQAEVEEMGSLLEQANKERDSAKKAARKWEGTCAGLTNEADLLRQQLRDLSTQVKILLVEVQAREQGLEAMSAEEQNQLEQVARGELEEGSLEGMSDTGRFISQRLVIFRNVKELQKQNEDLLRLTRHLGEEMEGEEAKAKRNQQALDQQELESLRTRISEYQDHIQSLTTRSESYIRERDMFRRMLSHRGQLPAGTDLAAVFGQSVDGSIMPATPSRAHSVEPSADARALADHVKLLKEMQQHFDAYREEASIDHQSLKQQVDQLSKQKGELQNENARNSSQLILAQERYGLLQSNYNMLKTENSELQKRTQVISENAAKQDIRTQQVAEELVEAKGLADSMRHENANLKAERELWKRIEARLTEDNRSLMDERSRLNKMLSDVQSLQNERELSDSDTRRRLQSRVEGLESELSAVKRKLDEEVDQAKKAALRREYEQEQNRSRIEDLLKSSANYKEELVASKTQRDQLQARVDELKIELRNAEEKAHALQPRPSTRPGGTANHETDENALTREQELSVEIADLKRDLELKQGELRQAQEETEQYKAIAQSSEESLQNINETNDLYREETDQTLAENETKIRDLEKRVEEISSELASAHTELSETRARAEESAARLNEEKTRYEAELARLRDESERLAETARLHQEDLKAQAEIAQQAQQNYEDELVKHANAASTLQKLRDEHNQLKTEVAGFKVEAETAKATLAQNEDSWSETRNRYEQEITELKNRREDVNTQNQRLMKQLEDVSSQIAALKQSRVASEDDSTGAGSSAGAPDNNLQEIINYLRHEKEILDMQYELSIQESKRVKQQLDHALVQLDQTREKLEQERQTQVDKEQNATSHAKLMQTINELNLFRESNSSLRNEARSAQEQLARKTKEVEELIAQLEPIQVRLHEVEHELESKDGELSLLQEDRDRWQKRTQDIMSKYDRVDPAELEGLRSNISSLETERDTLLAAKQELESGLDERIRVVQEENDKRFKDSRERIINQSKTKVRELNEVIRKLKEELAIATQDQTRLSLELSNANQELSNVKEELEKTKAARDEALLRADKQAPTPVQAGEEGQVDEGLSEQAKAEFEARIAASQAQYNAEAQKVANLQQELQRVQVQAQGLNGQVGTLQQNLDTANAQVSALQNTPQLVQEGSSNEELEKLRVDIVAKQREIEALKATADVAASMGNGTQDGSKPIAEQVQEQVEQISNRLTSEHNQRISLEEEKYKKRADQMKTALTKKLTDGKQAIRDQEKAEHDKAIEQLKAEHRAELERLRSDHQQELERLNVQGASISSAPPIESNGTKPAEWKPSPEEIKHLLQTNPHVKQIITGNIAKQVDRQKEVLTAQIKQEEEKIWAAKLNEANKAAVEAKEKAVELEGKKMKVKLNMLENRAKSATAQIDVVKQAATETPQRPVGEVWNIAKDTKAVAVVRPTPHAAASSTPAILAIPQQQAQQPPRAPQVPQPASVPTQASPPVQPITVQTAPPVGNNPNALPPRTGTPPVNPFVSGTPTGPSQGASSGPNPFAQSNGPPTGPSQGTTGAHNPFGAPTTGPGQGVPPTVNPFQATTNQHPPASFQGQSHQQSNLSRTQTHAAGTGPAALRNIMGQNQASSGIPRPGSGAPQAGRGRGGFQQQGQLHQPQQGHQQQQQQQQGFQQPAQQQGLSIAGAARGGSNLPRGPGMRGGRGGGRGQQVQTSGQPQQGGPNSPGAGRGGANLNPGARQFNPGAGIKRPHEGGEGGNAEKKPKGSGE